MKNGTERQFSIGILTFHPTHDFRAGQRFSAQLIQASLQHSSEFISCDVAQFPRESRREDITVSPVMF